MSVAALLAAGALACGPAPAAAGNAAQLVTVAAAPGSTLARLELWAWSGSCWQRVAGPWRARVGVAGISAAKREGDDSTPAGVFRIGPTAYGLDANPGWHGRYHRLGCGDWWDEDPASPSYNRFRHVPCGTSPPFGGGSEALWRATVAYREFAVIEYNAGPVVPGRGSAIFLHDDTGGPTAGCVSLPRPQLLRVLRWLIPAAHARIAIRIA